MSPSSIKIPTNDGVGKIEADHSVNLSDETHLTSQSALIRPSLRHPITQPTEKLPAPNPYTIFTPSQKRLITLCIGIAMFFSPMTANIYFPLLPALQLSTRSTLQLLNLTITAYIVMQGLSPLVFGDLADTLGRRPVYLLTFTLYTTASLGLALNRTSYAALLALRMLQSAGCSATAAASYGVLADVAMPADRGQMLGAAMVAANLGPSFGPLVGGVLADRAGWQWVFWFLLITGGSFLLVLFLFFPETARSIVGNGSVPAPHGINRAPLFFPRRPSTAEEEDGVAAQKSKPQKLTFWFPNLFKSLKIVFYKDAALVLWMSAMYYTAYYCVQASIPNLFLDIYGTINQISGDDLRTFPIEGAPLIYELRSQSPDRARSGPRSIGKVDRSFVLLLNSYKSDIFPPTLENQSCTLLFS